jgi:hypothetical protein
VNQLLVIRVTSRLSGPAWLKHQSTLQSVAEVAVIQLPNDRFPHILLMRRGGIA